MFTVELLAKLKKIILGRERIGLKFYTQPLFEVHQQCAEEPWNAPFRRKQGKNLDVNAKLDLRVKNKGDEEAWRSTSFHLSLCWWHVDELTWLTASSSSQCSERWRHQDNKKRMRLFKHTWENQESGDITRRDEGTRHRRQNKTGSE